MDHAYSWSNLPIDEILIAIVHKLSCAEDYIRFTAVCKTWKAATEDYKPLLPPKYPLLLLAEDVAPGSIISDGEYDSNIGYSSDHSDDNGSDSETDSDSEAVARYEATKHLSAYYKYDHGNNSIGSSRGLYSLLTGKTYALELPEAAGRLILGANHGWLLTLGRDLEIHLLHPLLRYQIALPPMLTLPIQYKHHENFLPEAVSDMFIRRVALSSKVPTKDAVLNQHDTGIFTPPIVMVGYGECGYLAFARLGDKAWTDVDSSIRSIEDIVYYKGRFFTVNFMGSVFVCHMDDKGGCRATQIASIPSETCDNQKYLVESVSGTLLLVVRDCKVKLPFFSRRCKYRTTKFLVWKLDLTISEGSSAIPFAIPSCTLIQENSLGNQAIFVGKGSSVSVSSSETIRPNCIYFTDDKWECYYREGGGHDMGIFNMETHTIEPHFPGKSIHHISPPLWYI